MQPDPAEPPVSFRLPPLPPVLREWFDYVSRLGDESELIFGGEILDGLRVVDGASARRALAGYRFVYENGIWVDEVERGNWDEQWIVLDSINADPIIADIASPDVTVLADQHGRGLWDPQPLVATLREFIAALEVNDDVPLPPPLEPVDSGWSVWATDLGPGPMNTLVSLRKWPLFTDFDRSGLLELRQHLPARIAAGLTETGARSCVEHGAALGATFEARTYERGSTGTFGAADLAGLWSDSANDDDTEPAPSDQAIAALEAELGFRLPDSYIELARTRNGGPLARGAFPMTEPTGWAEDHIAVTGISAIGRSSRSSLGGELGASFMREEWGYPAWGICFADTPTAGHQELMLDYRECGPDGEPRVVYVDQEDDFSVTAVAPDFATFIRGLVDEDTFAGGTAWDAEAERAAAAEAVAHGSFSPTVLRALAAAPELAFVEPALRTLGRRIVERNGFFAVHADEDSRMLLDAMFLLHGRLGAPASYEEYVRFDERSDLEHPTLETMLFFSTGEPYDFCTRGYAPGFVEDWWTERTTAGSIRSTPGGWRFASEAERSVMADLRRLA